MSFCRDPLWDLNQTWKTDIPDFTVCFHSTVLVYVPIAFLILSFPVQIYQWLVTCRNRNIPWTLLNISQLAGTLFLAILSTAQFLVMMVDDGNDGVIPSTSERLAPVLQVFALLIVAIAETLNRKRGVISSGSLFIYWILSVICLTFTFTSVIRFPQKYPNYSVTLFCLYYPFVVGTFLLFFFADRKPNYICIEEATDKPSPELFASYPSLLTFSWFTSVIIKGWKKPMEQSDLYDLPANDKCSGVMKIWEKNWAWYKAKKEVSGGSGTRVSIFTPLMWTFWGILLESTFIRLLTIILQLTSPNVLSLLINFATGTEETWKGYLYIIALVSVQFLNSILTSQYFYQNMIIGLRIRTVLSSALFRKSLRLSISSRKNLTVGETVNLMSIDSQRLMDLMQSANSFWSSPLTIGMSLYFLWGYLGVSALAGLGVMIILIPINAVLSTRLRKYQFANMKTKDKRIRFMNEILDGIKVLKLYAWEPSFANKISEIREEEVLTLKKTAYLSAIQTFLFSAAPFLVALASFTTYVLIDPNNVLDAQTAFVSLSFFNLMRMPLNMIPSLIVQTVQALVSFKRLNDFLNAKEIDIKSIEHNPDPDFAVNMKKASFTWDREISPALKCINVQIKKGSLVAVVGRVGSGKSSLLSALSTDMEKIVGDVNVDGRRAYLPQQAWMQNATLRYNITFGSDYNEDVYNKVVDACALRPDLDILAQSDMTEIGEKGINLSGGQKQRVSLARAVYSNRDVYLLDDPLSAVDAHVGKHIFDHVIGPSGLLKNKTRILVTNAVGVLPNVDYIYVMKDGAITDAGTFKELLSTGGAFAEFLLENIQQVSEEEGMEELKTELEQTLGLDKESTSRPSLQRSDSIISTISMLLKRRSRQTSADNGLSNQRPREGPTERTRGTGRLMVDERVETTAVKRDVYIYYAKAVGFLVATGALLLQIANQGFSLGTNFWLARWSDDQNSAEVSVRNQYLGVYGALGGFSALAIMISSLFVAVGGLNASSKLHNKMLTNVLAAPMSFFDTNPKGRVMNRFAKDVDYVDRSIPMTLEALVRLLFQVGGTIVAICYTNPIFIVVIVPLSVLYLFIQKLYVQTSRQLRRLESISRSPIYSHFGEVLSGTPTIRAFELESRFIKENEEKIDMNQSCYQPNIAANRWLAIRLEMLGNIIVFFAALFAVISRGSIDPGLVGLSLSYASQITMSLNMLIRQSSQVETSMVSVERIQEYQDHLEKEAPYIMPEQDPSSDWPQYGEVEFKDYKTRYREGLDLVLKGVSCKIQSGEKVGIVGRTGAGKSSLTLALFRIIEPSGGTIVIDNQNIAQMGLGSLRSKLTIIPQDPVLFSGSLRFNIDPFHLYSDEQIWHSLELSHLKAFVSGLSLGLEHEINEGGSNLSVGQKQLVCLARALLRKTKVLILDEATAAVDLETDDLIQQTIRREFADCTVITIAHRLKTILDYNRIIVMSDGKIAEFDSPKQLLQDPKTRFASMAKDAGISFQEFKNEVGEE